MGGVGLLVMGLVRTWVPARLYAQWSLPLLSSMLRSMQGSTDSGESLM